jgi:hypothetical protein
MTPVNFPDQYGLTGPEKWCTTANSDIPGADVS